ncbi:hypothetical protein MRX96_041451 [Rhipicephalus microplus]
MTASFRYCDYKITSSSSKMSNLQAARFPSFATPLPNVLALTFQHHFATVFDALDSLSHPGIRSTRRLITGRYLWPRMNIDVRRWTHACLKCQLTKVPRNTVSPLGTFTPPDSWFSHVYLDLVGPLPPIAKQPVYANLRRPVHTVARGTTPHRHHGRDLSPNAQQDGNREATGKSEVGLPDKVNEIKKEKVDASSTTDILSGEAVETHPEPELMSEIDDSASTTGKRPYDAEKSEKGPRATMTDEPPAKTIPARRPLLMPRPNFSAVRRMVETPPSTPGDRIRNV